MQKSTMPFYFTFRTIAAFVFHEWNGKKICYPIVCNDDDDDDDLDIVCELKDFSLCFQFDSRNSLRKHNQTHDVFDNLKRVHARRI